MRTKPVLRGLLLKSMSSEPPFFQWPIKQSIDSGNCFSHPTPSTSKRSLFPLSAFVWVNVIIDCLFLLRHFISFFPIFEPQNHICSSHFDFCWKIKFNFMIDSPFWGTISFAPPPHSPPFCEANSTHNLIQSILISLNQKFITGFCTYFASL